MKTETTNTKTTTTTPPGTYATKIFVFYQDTHNNDEKGIASFDNKKDLDQWLKETNVMILRVFRGREKTIATRVIFQ